MAKENQSFETKLIHAGEPKPRIDGAINVPIFQSSTYEYAGEGSYHDVRYLRLSNTPNHLALHKKLAALEGAEAALVTSSGMSAITTALLTFLKVGDHLLAHNTLYGGTADFVNNDVAMRPIQTDFAFPYFVKNPNKYKPSNPPPVMDARIVAVSCNVFDSVAFSIKAPTIINTAVPPAIIQATLK